MLFDAQRPMVLNGIGNFITESDLVDRAQVLELPSMGNKRRIDEKQFWVNFNAAHPKLFGALLEGVAASMRGIDSVEERSDWPRMADFAKWVTAAETELGWGPGSFGGAFQSPQRARRSGGDPPAEDMLDELSPPAWQESEASVVRHAARVCVDRRDLNPFVIRDTEGKPDIQSELQPRTHVEHVEPDAQPAEYEDDMITRAHWARRAFDQLKPGPLRQFARIGEQLPNALCGGEDDVGRTNLHTPLKSILVIR
jgi:hypothetical protein